MAMTVQYAYSTLPTAGEYLMWITPNHFGTK